MKIDEDWRQRQCSILFPSVPSPVKQKILTQHFPNSSSSPLFPSPQFPWSGWRLTPETMFVIVPCCPFCCEAKIRSPSPKSFVPSSLHCFGLQEAQQCWEHLHERETHKCLPYLHLQLFLHFALNFNFCAAFICFQCVDIYVILHWICLYNS